MNIARLLARSAQVYPERLAVMHGQRALHSYRELEDRAASLGHFLRAAMRLETGDRVTIYMTNRPEYLEALYGILWAGLVAVPVNAKLHPREVEHILQDSGSRLMFVSPDLADDLHSVLQENPSHPQVVVAGDAGYVQAVSSPQLGLVHREPDDLAWLFYTSGTTGRSKGVMLTHRNLMAMTAGYFTDVDVLESEDVIVYAAPMSHGAGLYSFAFTLKACCHLIPESGGFDPDELIGLSRSVGRMSMFAAPTMVKRLVQRVRATAADPGGFKTIVYGGGPMYLEDIRNALQVMGSRFVQIYGQGESPMTITALPRALLADQGSPDWEARAASVGVAQAMVEVRIADHNGQALPPGEIGEVLVRGHTVMAGYWQHPAATEEALRGGWLWTGDMGVMDSRGFVTLKDRSKDVIISGGSNIYPREVEEVLLKHPGVLEVSVVGKLDPEWGEIPVAFVVGEGVSATALDQLCLFEIARFKRPKEYHFVRELPKNNYGKILKTALRAML